MATPYLARPIRLGDPVVTSTTDPITTDKLRPNDYIVSDGDFLERSGSTPFTGATLHTARWTTGYIKVKPIKLSNANEITTFESGNIKNDRKHFPRQSVQITIQNVTNLEADSIEQFYFISCGDKEIYFYDENSKKWPCVWTSEVSITKDKSNNAAAPNTVVFSLMGTGVSKLEIESGTNRLS